MCTSDANASPAGLDWVPESCTLPTAEQPIRVAEFDDLFTASVRGAQRVDRTTLRLTVAADAEAQARDLAGRESSCCSFFGFDFAPAGEAVTMTVTVPAAHVAVLDAFAARAAAAAAAGLSAPVAG
ncbi:hypothetical protein [Kribbella sp. CA-294648]|uniref:hypothetical protein n=1 Tax=Kribbella sp. CA-294648 TaxID=3239948 RepID=UPI003D917EFC